MGSRCLAHSVRPSIRADPAPGGRPGPGFFRGSGPDTVHVLVVHRIYGNCLDRSELLTSVANVAGQADDADEEFVARFGGSRFSDAMG